MPRLEIKRDAKGNKVQSPKQGDQLVNVEVTYDSKVNLSGHEDIVWKTATGGTPLHKSDKVKGQGNLNAIGYIHSSQNQCFLVTRLDTAKKTIQIDKQGKVNAGVHEF
jgi:hypothetical protein